MKRFIKILFLVFVFLCLSVVLVNANNNGNSLIGDLNFNGFLFRTVGDTAILSGVVPEYSEREILFLPDEIEGILNITIDKGAFGASVKAKQIVLSPLVTEIREGAFAGCPNLNIVNLPASIKNLQSPILKNCSNLRYLILDKGFRYQLLDRAAINNYGSKDPKKINIVSEHSVELVSHLKNNGFKNFITSEQIKYRDIYMFMTECNHVLNPSEIKVCIDGKIVDSEVIPTIIDGRTMVPLRAVFQEMGANVNWDDINRQAKISMANSEVEFSPEVCEIMVNGEKVMLDVAPQIIDGRILVPIRAISEALECKVFWDNELQIVAISTNPISVSMKSIEYELYHDDILKIYSSTYDSSEYIKYLIEGGYYIVGYNSYGECILKNSEEYIGVSSGDVGVYAINWESADMNLTNVEMNMILMDSSNIGTNEKNNYNNYNNNSYGNVGNNYNTEDTEVNLSDVAILAEIASIESRIGKLQSRLNNIMSERNVRVLADGEWRYTYDHQAAAAVREQIENLQLKLSIYKQSLN